MSVSPPRKRSRRWVPFFLVLTALATTGVILPIVYNLGQQLRPEQLDEARRRWNEVGPRDYDLTFSIQFDRDLLAQRHIVLVRQGQVVYASCEGELLTISPAIAALIGSPAAATTGRGMDVSAIFERIQQLLDEDERRRNFLVAVFDPKEGWPRRVIWRVRRSSTREEWNLRVWPAGELERKAGEGR